MKCLLCNFQSNDLEDVKKHYIDFHNVDRNNQFFIKLFKKQNNVFHGKKCLRCNKFVPTSRLLAHYNDAKNVFEEKPVNYTNLGEIRKYENTFAQHSHDYDFCNSEKLVDNFLLNVKNRVGRFSNDFLIKCGFSLENIQPSPFENEEPIRNSRYWSTKQNQIKSFNDFVYCDLRESILKKVINNGMGGSSWHFNRFLYINVKILGTGNQLFQ